MTPASKLLRAALRGDDGDFQATLAACEPGTLLELSAEELGPYIYWRASEARAPLPESAESPLKMEYLAQWDRAERMKASLSRLAGLLEASGIEIIVLKGPLSSQRYFGHELARVSRDIDFLVPEGKAREAEEILLGAGYIPKTRSSLIRRLSAPYIHHAGFLQDGFAHELHWALRRHPTYRIDYQRLWSRKEPAELDERAYSALSADYELTLQSLALVDDIERGCSKLKALVDIAAIALRIEGHEAWGELFEEKEREGILRPVVWSLSFARDTLGIAGDLPGLSERLDERIESLGLAVPSELPAKAWSLKWLGWSIREGKPAANMAWWLKSLPLRTLSN